MRSGPSEAPPEGAQTLPPLEWRRNATLFVATVASVFGTQFYFDGSPLRERIVSSSQFTASLLTILLAHEFGHYFAARLHKVEASLPYFIPLPILSPFGTMGAVIRMRGVIPTRRALLDIGASGPLAGLVFAIPLYIWGVVHSRPVTVEGLESGIFLGESLALKLLDHVFGPSVPEGMELALSPVAYGAWGGMFVTMINLIPVGQLDGGHVAYALFGPKQNAYAKVIHRAMLAFFFVSLGSYVLRDVRAGLGTAFLGRHIQNSLFWLVWFEVLAVLGTLSASRAPRDERGRDEGKTLTVRDRIVAIFGIALVAGIAREASSPVVYLAWFGGVAVLLAMEVRGGVLRPNDVLDHPPTGEEKLGPVRTAVAVVTLALFGALFMTSPFVF